MQNTWDAVQICTTYGEVFEDAVIDVLRSADGDEMELVYWNGAKTVIAPQVEHNGIFYKAPVLDPSIHPAVRFPAGVTDYTTPKALFDSVAVLFSQYLGFSAELATWGAIWVFATWLPELFAIVPILCIAASTPAPVNNLCRLLNSVCRRGLVTAELTRQLPIELRPTLLVTDSGLSAKKRAFWRASSYHGVYVCGSAGKLRDLTCAKAIYCSDPTADWGEAAMPLSLSGAVNAFPPLTAKQQEQIAADYQPRLEMFRMRRLLDGRRSPAASVAPEFANSEFARSLLTCIPEDTTVAELIAPFLKAQQEQLNFRRSQDPRLALVEALWGPTHDGGEISPAELAKRVNTILRARGENYEYSAREIGWKLSGLALQTQRSGKSKLLRFTREIRSRIHQLARQFAINVEPIKGCPECAARASS